MTLNSLPDNILLEIFAFRLSSAFSGFSHSTVTMEWQKLVQVCQRWKEIIYGSPRYLKLHLHCSNATPFRENHSRWPEFPLILEYTFYADEDDSEDVADIIAAFEQPNRVHIIILTIASFFSRGDNVLQKMNVSFPALTHLDLMGPDHYDDHEGIVLPRGFLGGSAPCLQHLRFNAVNTSLFQELPSVLFSARGLVSLRLEDIPDCLGYISPEAMVRGLAGSTEFRALSILFRFPEEPPEPNEGLEHRRRPEPPMRAVLPTLTEFIFSGESAYLEDIMAQIDMPSVEDIKIDYFPTGDEVRELSRFIGRTEHLGLAQFRLAQVYINVDPSYSQIKLDHPQGKRFPVRLLLGTMISEPGQDSSLDDLVACMGRLLGQITPLLSNVGHLSFEGQQGWDWESDRFDDCTLLPLLHFFPAVEALHVFGVLARHFETELENIDEERVSEVMPALRSLQLGDGIGPVGSVGSIERFLTLRQLSGHPVAVVTIDTQD